MIKIGITGSIASGKTTASKIISFRKGPLFNADDYVRKNEYIQSGDTSKLKGVNKKIENYEKQLNIMSPTLIIKSNDQSKRIDTIKSKRTNGSSEKQKIIVMTKTVEKNVPVLDTMPVGVA